MALIVDDVDGARQAFTSARRTLDKDRAQTTRREVRSRSVTSAPASCSWYVAKRHADCDNSDRARSD